MKTNMFQIVAQHIPGFIVGILTSGIVAFIFYLRQKHEAERVDRGNFMVQYFQWKLLRGAKTSVDTVANNQDALLAEFRRLQKALTFALSEQRLSKAYEIVEKYDDVAFQFGPFGMARLLADPPSTKRLTIDLLQSIHARLYPPDYEMAGRFRTVQIYIMDMRSGEPKIRFRPPTADKAKSLTEELILKWHDNYEQVAKGTEQDKMLAIAKFHHGLLSIHPFQDGNGRLARFLLTLQVRELLGRSVSEDWPKQQYYKSLLEADQGNIDLLVQIIRERVSE